MQKLQYFFWSLTLIFTVSLECNADVKLSFAEALVLLEKNETDDALNKFREGAQYFYDEIFRMRDMRYFVMAHLLKGVLNEPQRFRAKRPAMPGQSRLGFVSIATCAVASQPSTHSSLARSSSITLLKPKIENKAVKTQALLYLCKAACRALALGSGLPGNSEVFIKAMREALNNMPCEYWLYIPRIWVKHICGQAIENYIFKYDSSLNCDWANFVLAELESSCFVPESLTIFVQQEKDRSSSSASILRQTSSQEDLGSPAETILLRSPILSPSASTPGVLDRMSSQFSSAASPSGASSATLPEAPRRLSGSLPPGASKRRRTIGLPPLAPNQKAITDFFSPGKK